MSARFLLAPYGDYTILSDAWLNDVTKCFAAIGWVVSFTVNAAVIGQSLGVHRERLYALADEFLVKVKAN